MFKNNFLMVIFMDNEINWKYFVHRLHSIAFALEKYLFSIFMIEKKN